MGLSFRPTGGGKSSKDETCTSDTKGSPSHAAKTQEKPARRLASDKRLPGVLDYPTKPFCRANEAGLKRIAHILTASKPDEEVGVNTVVANVPRSEAEKARTDARPLHIIALFCGLGLLTSLYMMSFGLDLSAGFF